MRGHKVIRIFDISPQQLADIINGSGLQNEIYSNLNVRISKEIQEYLLRGKGKYEIFKLKELTPQEILYYENRISLLETKNTNNTPVLTHETSNLPTSDFLLDFDQLTFVDGGFYIHPYTPKEKIRNFKGFKLYFHKDDLCRESFQYIREYIFKHVPPIICYVGPTGNLHINNELSLKNALKFIIESKQKYILDLIEKEKRNQIFCAENVENAISALAKMSLEDYAIYKNEFTTFLQQNQLSSYKIVPCLEKVIHSSSNTIDKEEGFFFTLPTKNKEELLLIYENLSKFRATEIFHIKKDYYSNILQTLFDFLQSEQENKRRKLRNRDNHFSLLGIINVLQIDHDSFESWGKILISKML